MLTFDKENHIYKWNGEQVLSVTQILKMTGLSQGIVDEVAAERGRQIHQACHFYDEQDLDERKLADWVKPYLEGWKKFNSEYNLSWITWTELEKPMFSGTYKFAGTPDRIGFFEGKKSIVDIKSGAIDWATGLQLAGYDILAGGGCKRYAIQLFEDGNYKLTAYTDKTDKQIFLAATIVANARFHRGEKIND